jgi:hypothetical protein
MHGIPQSNTFLWSAERGGAPLEGIMQKLLCGCIILVALLSLTGCGEARETALKQCKLESLRVEQSVARTYVIDCMDLKGYDPKPGYSRAYPNLQPENFTTRNTWFISDDNEPTRLSIIIWSIVALSALAYGVIRSIVVGFPTDVRDVKQTDSVPLWRNILAVLAVIAPFIGLMLALG